MGHSRARIAAGLAAAALVLAGCTAPAPARPGTSGATMPPEAATAATPKEPVTVLDAAGARLALEASRTFFASAPTAVVLAPGGEGDGGATATADGGGATATDDGGATATGDDDGATATGDGGAGGTAGLDAAARAAEDLGAPLLLATGDPGDLRAELDRLGAGSVTTFGAPEGGWDALLGDRERRAGDGAGPAAPAAAGGPGPDSPAVAVHLDGDAAGPGERAAAATAVAAGAELRELAGPDPRTAADRGFFAQRPDAPVVALGDGFGDPVSFAGLVRTAATGPELPGGGQVLFPDRRFVALYGHPETAALGALGEQGVDAAIERVRRLAEDYQAHSGEPVQPAFEIIATVASAAPGADGNYSRRTDIDVLEEWVDAAGEAGVYVVLDLQPGRTDFLTQAKHYERLLAKPHVGIAYDPEWRLLPGQRHMAQIGSVEAEELNRTNAWLAGLVRKHSLPQKLVIVHQFQRRMVAHREDLDAGHPELATLVHADGHGTPGEKMATWENVRRDLPEGVRMAWKNFLDEDRPTFTPGQTFAVRPKPWFVSYQ